MLTFVPFLAMTVASQLYGFYEQVKIVSFRLVETHRFAYGMSPRVTASGQYTRMAIGYVAFLPRLMESGWSQVVANKSQQFGMLRPVKINHSYAVMIITSNVVFLPLLRAIGTWLHWVNF
jgi:hypothetical protein